MELARGTLPLIWGLLFFSCARGVREDNIEWSSHVLGTSLAISLPDTPGGPNSSIDEHGLGGSLLDLSGRSNDRSSSSLNPLGTSLLNFATSQDDLSFDHEHFVTSTPAKRKSVSDFQDLELFSTVLASPHVPTRKVVYTNSNNQASCLTRRKLDHNLIVRDIAKTCNCPKACMQLIDFNGALKLRQALWTRNKFRDRTEWIMDKLRTGFKNSRWTYASLDILGFNTVCLNAFRLIMGVDKNTMTRLRSGLNPIKKERSQSEGTVEAITWLESYASLYGDRMPDRKEVLLPLKTQKRNVYQLYSKETRQPVSSSTFDSVWSNHFSHLKIKKINSFSRCTKCALLQRQLEMAEQEQMRQKIRHEITEHNQRQMLERKCYYSKRERSRQQPRDYLSLIIDGMDQSKTDLPHFTGRRAKVINPTDLLGTHISGVISHGHNSFTTYLDILEYPHDPNLTINLLMKTLLSVVDQHDVLPPVLYVQADNCYRENKNRFVLGFLELLVRMRIFNEVHLSFLYVGHTHEDIDAAFSTISRKLRTTPAETLPDILKLMPNGKRLNGMYDVKRWIDTYIFNIKYISKPMHFKIVRQSKKIRVFYKGQQHTMWKPIDGNGCFLKGMPSGIPRILKPDYEKLDKLLPRTKKLIHSVTSMFSSEEKKEWWTKFFETYKQEQHVYTWINVLPRQREDQTIGPILTLQPEVQLLLDKETQEPQLQSTGKSLKVTKSKKKEATIRRKAHKTAKSCTGRNPPQIRRKTKDINPPAQKKSGNSSKGQKGKRQKRYHTPRLEIAYNGDEKRHLWFIILSDMICVIRCIIYILLVLFLQILLMTDLILLIRYIYKIWQLATALHLQYFVQRISRQIARQSAQRSYFDGTLSSILPRLSMCH